MTPGEKIRKLRTENGMTQDELAEKLFVTRTAVSKWETDKGFPSVDSLKEISKLFSVSIDSLVSDEDIENRKKSDNKSSRKYYYASMAFAALTAVSVFLLSYFKIFERFGFISAVFIIGYIICAFFAKPKYKREESKRQLACYVASRILIVIILASVIVGIFMK